MVDLTQLTQEQRWGVDYACLKANELIVAENQRITQENASLPDDQKKPLKPLLTSQLYIDSVVRSACDSYYKQLIDFKKTNALAMFDALTPEQQAALVAQLNIPDVLHS